MLSLGYRKNKIFYTQLLTLMMPIVIQNFISSSLNLVDNIMIGTLGESQIAAVGLANQVYFLMSLVLFGTFSGASIFVAQFWGSKSLEEIKKVLGLEMIFGVLLSTLFFIGSYFFTEQIFSILSPDPLVISIGSIYLKRVSLSFIPTAISFAFGFSTRSVGKATLPMYTSAVSLLVNTVLNYILIFGHFGFPAYGVLGAATGTLIARFVECIFMIVGIYRTIPELAIQAHHIFKPSLSLLKRVLKKAIPVILNETFWSLGMIAYTIVYAKIGTNAAASVMITNTVNNLFFVISIGLGNATAILLGNTLGAGEIDRAVEYNQKLIALGLISGAVVGVVIFVLSSSIINAFYTLSPEAYLLTVNTFHVLAFYMPFKFYNTITIVGTLRSGGDTLFSMILELSCVWGIGVPMAVIGGLVWHLPVYFVVGLVSLEELTKALVGIPRIRSRKWAQNLALERS
ncbi:MAG: hypothetical protein PWQ12_90 [Clostridiales bacterium]|nr:hypothetical protein [Clostridiales bacterium]